MLNTHDNPLQPRSERLRVGECVIDVPRREVMVPNADAPRRITVKALHVLLALAAHQGRVVSREALFEWVWPDTMPTDDVLTQAITQLRKVFGDERDAPRYLETISKGGYRLLATVEWMPSPASPSTDADVALAAADATHAAGAPAPRRRAAAIGAVLGVLLLVVAMALYAVYRNADRRDDPSAAKATAPAAAPGVVAPLEFKAITSRPGREHSPNLSPDGAMVAYVETPQGKPNSAIMVQTTAQVTPRQLTHPDDSSWDFLPVWSHDGRRLAFVRTAEPDGCQIMLIAASGGEARKAGDCYGGNFHTYDWTPDDSGLLMGGTRLSSDTESPLRLLDLSTGQWRALDYPISDGDIDVNPHYSPDGKSLVFRRAISLSDLWMMPAAGGTPKRLTQLRGDIRGWDWLPDGSGLVFTLIGSEDWLYRYDMKTAAVTPLGIMAPALMPDIAARSPAMVFEIDQMRTGIFRYDFAGDDGPATRSEQLFASSGSDLLPAVSPDGSMLAFVSDRSAQPLLWIGVIGRPDTLRPIEGPMPVIRHLPVWSADGRRLLMIAVVDGRQELREIEIGSDVSRRLPVPAETPVYAAYTDVPGRMLVGNDGGEGRLRLALYDTSQPAWRELASIDDVALAKFDPQRKRVYFTRASRPGLWSSDAGLQNVALVEASQPYPMNYRNWAIGDGDVYLLARTASCATGWSRLPKSDRGDAVCLDKSRSTATGMPGLGPSGRAVYLAMPVSDNVDIGWAMLPTVGGRSGR
jgi:Tol biopolymer transport system component/DNA-binding winged helix-turn-helix (wHTH) protein